MTNIDPQQLRAAADGFACAMLAADAEHLSPICVGCTQPKPKICGRYSIFCPVCWRQFPKELKDGLSRSGQTAAGAVEWLQMFAVALDGLSTTEDKEDDGDRDS